MHTELKPNASAAGLRIGVAISRYHPTITECMRDAAVKQFGQRIALVLEVGVGPSAED